MSEHYSSLDMNERRQIYLGLMKRKSIPEIARCLGRHRSTIHREVQRNTFYHIRVALASRAGLFCNGTGFKPEEVRHHAQLSNLVDTWTMTLKAVRAENDFVVFRPWNRAYEIVLVVFRNLDQTRSACATGFGTSCTPAPAGTDCVSIC
jgi:hypothetical protein